MTRPANIIHHGLVIMDGDLGWDPSAQTTDVPDPVDLAAASNGAIAYIPVSTSVGDGFLFAQSKASGNSGPLGGGRVTTLDSVPTTGNLLIAFTGNRAGHAPIEWPDGWDLIAELTDTSATHGGSADDLEIRAKRVTSASDQTLNFDAGGSAVFAPESCVLSEWIAPDYEIDDSATAILDDDATGTFDELTTTASSNLLILAAQWKGVATPDPGPQTLTDYTVVDDSGYAFLGNRTRLSAWYRIVESSGTSYGPATLSSSGSADNGALAHVALRATGSSTVWIEAPFVIDGNDATFDIVDMESLP